MAGNDLSLRRALFWGAEGFLFFAPIRFPPALTFDAREQLFFASNHVLPLLLALMVLGQTEIN